MQYCYAEVGTIKQFQKHSEYLRRAGKSRKDVFHNVADLRNFQVEHRLPDTVDEMDPYSMYTPDIDWASYPGVLAICLISQITVKWIGQLIQPIIRWALHGDGTHKIHIGRWVLMTFGTHVLGWDEKAKAINSSLCLFMRCYAAICSLYALYALLCCSMLFLCIVMREFHSYALLCYLYA